MPTTPSSSILSDPSTYPFDLGTHTRPINTSSPLAQQWFNYGLIWTYSFHHEEAIRCFENALKYDDECVMAYWGIAYASGPNYNRPWEAFDEDEVVGTVKRGRQVLRDARREKGRALKRDGSSDAKDGLMAHQAWLIGQEKEDMLVKALERRYGGNSEEGNVIRDGERLTAERKQQLLDQRNEDYATAMKIIYKRYPDDLDIATLTADALMNLTPWALWDLRTGQPTPGAHTHEIKLLLETALTLPNAPQHPGLFHLYIHLMEMSPHPEAALPYANRLRGLVPDSGHLNHMPTHIDILLGDYQNAMHWNSVAIDTDEKYLTYAGPHGFYTLYRCHDYHFRIYAAMFAGNKKVAIATVERLEELCLGEDVLKGKDPSGKEEMADYIEAFGAVRVEVYVRFGMWEELTRMREKEDGELWCVTNAFERWGRSVAFAVLERVEEAEAERVEFEMAIGRVKGSRTLFNNKATDLLAIAAEMLDGELAYRKGDVEKGFEHLRKAIDLDDNLPYDEPWGWMTPTRHAYGALLLEQGRVEEAAGVYSADLGYDDTLPRALRHPNNMWALSGYEECMRRMGRDGDAKEAKQRLVEATRSSDIGIGSSCFCRKPLN